MLSFIFPFPHYTYFNDQYYMHSIMDTEDVKINKMVSEELMVGKG